MHKDMDAVLVAQLEQLCKFWGDLALILQADKDVRINEELAVSHITRARIRGGMY